FRALLFDPAFLVFVFDVVLFLPLEPRLAFGWIRSGSVLLPVERFHSSYVWSEILPVIKSSANLRRCALLLNGIRLILRLLLSGPDLQGRHPSRVARRRPRWCGHLRSPTP